MRPYGTAAAPNRAPQWDLDFLIPRAAQTCRQWAPVSPVSSMWARCIFLGDFEIWNFYPNRVISGIKEEVIVLSYYWPVLSVPARTVFLSHPGYPSPNPLSGLGVSGHGGHRIMDKQRGKSCSVSTPELNCTVGCKLDSASSLAANY